MHAEIEMNKSSDNEAASDNEAENRAYEKKEASMARRFAVLVMVGGCSLAAWLAYLGYGDSGWTVALVSVLAPGVEIYRLRGR